MDRRFHRGNKMILASVSRYFYLQYAIRDRFICSTQTNTWSHNSYKSDKC